MFHNFLRTTLRGLWRNKGYSFMNIAGLAVGIACAGLIFLWVEDEVSFDAGHVKKDRLFIVNENQEYDAYVFTHSSTPGPLAEAMKKEIPGIANTCRTSEGTDSRLFTIGDKSVYASGKYAEASLFSMFTLPFVQGNNKNVFAQLYSIVITEKTAKKFFGDVKDVIGKTVRIDNKQDYVVTGVLKDIPENSSITFEWVAPFEHFFNTRPWLKEWDSNSLTTYVELEGGTSAATVNERLKTYIKSKVPGSIATAFLFGMNDWYLYSEFENGKQTGGGRIEYVRLFSIIAWIILLIACINFMNLATARSEKRAREVGVRKVLGAGVNRLIVQFISEALLMASIAAIVAVAIILSVLPAFNVLIQKQLTVGIDEPLHFGALLLITLICGVVAGSYPSFYLSSFNPVFVLKGIKLKTGSAAFIRKGLVVLQFTVSIILIVSTIIIYQQIQHIKSRNLGFAKEHLIEMKVQGEMVKNFSAIKQDLLATGVVDNVALSDHPTIYGGNNTNDISWKGKDPQSQVLISQRLVSPEYVATSGMKILDGRDFQPIDIVRMTDDFKPVDQLMSTKVVITESLAKHMGKESAIGKTLQTENDDRVLNLEIIGIVNDYVYGNMYGKPDPVIFYCLPQFGEVMYVRIKAGTRPDKTLTQIEAVLKRDNPGYPFEYRFVDDQFNQMFQNETLISKLSGVFAALAIIISCLGLFGLAAYTAERRTKEIGIRKVLGATAAGVARLLSKDFLQLAFISCLIAFPLAWWAMNKWLQDYQYRTDIHWWVFGLAGISTILITLLTVSFQAVKSAIANPVKSLRTE
ncbi:MAG TPA: ABC transporter permease [Chitinophagaceae bacterium]|jgi:predicted permease|nr:ABC transporter permease [Chitinophagaceae bacterium]